MFESDEEDEDWNKPVDSTLCVSQVSRSCSDPKISDPFLRKDGPDHSRVILHIDIDCFYAQVEMIRNPSLRNKPLGIQQKYIVVTCNYPARERGVTKLMRIVDAKEKCPELILVSGEDLTNYREMSYKISNYLQKYCPLVERLGFDENFLDITELVKDRLDSNECGREIKGFVYNEAEIQDCCGCGCHDRLKVGSQVAADIREGLHEELGITSCGGVAVNKLLSKLVAGKHKPNCQTTLFPEQITSLLRELSTTRQIPGIGSTTSRRLKEIGIRTVQELQNATKATLDEEFGTQAAENMKNWCYGIDNSPVIAFGLPQTLSDEDSFAARKVSTIAGVKKKFKDLIESLLQRLLTDGRTPRTFRLTVRKMSSDNKYLNRESRQCSLSTSIFQKFSKSNLPMVCSQLEIHAYDLFTKMIDIKKPFYLTLVNVAFTKLEQIISKNSITSFFSPKKTGTVLSKDEEDLQDYKSCTDPDAEKKHTNTDRCYGNKQRTFPGSINKIRSNIPVNTCGNDGVGFIKDNVKRKSGLFKWFQESGGINGNLEKDESCCLIANAGDKKVLQNKRKADESLQNLTCKISKPSNSRNSMVAKNYEKDQNNIPENFDENVFKQLPSDIQNEILSQHRIAQSSSKRRDVCAISNTKSEQNCDYLPNAVNGKSKSTFFSDGKGKGLNNSFTSSSTTIPTEMSSDSVNESSAIDKNSVLDNSAQMSSSNQRRPDIPQSIDRAVFEALPVEIQNEVLKDLNWGVQCESVIKDSSVISVKSPKSSSNVNIMSFFPKANKKK